MSSYRYIKALKFVVGVALISCLLKLSPAKAEWDWNDSEYLRNTFTSFVESKFLDENLPGSLPTIVPSRCTPLPFGYQGTWETNGERIYQIAFQDIRAECWERLKQVMPQTPFQIKEVKTVTKISFLPFADSGPSILFTFDKVATPPRCTAEEWMNYQNTSLSKISGENVYFFVTRNIKIDADGAPNAYHPQNIGLDDLQNAGYPDKSWWPDVLVPDPQNSSQAYIQPSGEFQGYFVSMTALEDSSKPETDPTRYVDATKIPYLVFPGAFYQMEGTGYLGDLGFAINLTSGQRTAFVVADIGPQDAALGEVSINLAEKLGGRNVNPRNGAGTPQGDFLYVLFPGSREEYKWPLSLDEIDEAADNLLNSIGGVEAITSCVNASS